MITQSQFDRETNDIIDMVSEMTISERQALRTELMTKLEVENANETIKWFFQHIFDNLA